MEDTHNKWLLWATRLQSLAQAGITYASDKYDIERYNAIRSIAVEIINEYTGLGTVKITDLFASETGYQTPKVDIRASVISEGRILMVKEKEDGTWSLPGGWADVNTSVSESAIRECREEAGATVLPGRLIAVHYANRRNNKLFPYTVYKIFVECELLSIEFRENNETLEARFFGPEELPVLSSNRNNECQINMCFAAAADSNFKTQFD